jgi:hypothetical protein
MALRPLDRYMCPEIRRRLCPFKRRDSSENNNKKRGKIKSKSLVLLGNPIHRPLYPPFKHKYLLKIRSVDILCIHSPHILSIQLLLQERAS